MTYRMFLFGGGQVTSADKDFVKHKVFCLTREDIALWSDNFLGYHMTTEKVFMSLLRRQTNNQGCAEREKMIIK
jgi:hypothetical protein